ncbi:DUF1932 domain-containing protein [Saccharopolyspora sp. NPDC047091]|uniref:DUF1932 domain-containing protein n=1 Tax=Saccharopolyspora sp. NPDC047091 TaxID=3155924 RepID=UPI00340D2B39
MTGNDRRPTIAVLGLGEAGGAFARDLLVAGAAVRGYDPAVAAPDGVVETTSEAEAATGADLVLSANSSAAAREALRAGAGAVAPHAAWADLNTASPATKRELDSLAEHHGVTFADVAIMAPVPGTGLRTPMLACGRAARQVVDVLNPLGAQVAVAEGGAGLAATQKLLRSVFFKGMSAAVVEALEAARAAGHEQWLRENIAAELAAAGESTMDRMVRGTHRHAVRRTAEMAAAAEMLTELGVEPAVATASRDLLARIAHQHD